MANRPRYYTTVPHIDGRYLRDKRLTNSQLKALLYLEYLAGPNDPNGRGAMVGIQDLRSRFSLRKSQVIAILNKLRQRGYVAKIEDGPGDPIIVLPNQPESKQGYTVVYEFVLYQEWWKVLLVLMDMMTKKGDCYQVVASTRTLLKRGIGAGSGDGEKLRHIKRQLMTLRSLNVIEVLVPPGFRRATVFRINMGKVNDLAVCSKVPNRTVTNGQAMARRKTEPTQRAIADLHDEPSFNYTTSHRLEGNPTYTTSQPLKTPLAAPLPDAASGDFEKDCKRLEDPKEDTTCADRVPSQEINSVTKDEGIEEAVDLDFYQSLDEYDQRDKQLQATATAIVEKLNQDLPPSTTPPADLVTGFRSCLPQITSLYGYTPSPGAVATDSLSAIRASHGEKGLPLGVLLEQPNHLPRFLAAYQDVLASQAAADRIIANSLPQEFPTWEADAVAEEIWRLNGMQSISPERVERVRASAIQRIERRLKQLKDAEDRISWQMTQLDALAASGDCQSVAARRRLKEIMGVGVPS